MSVCDPVDGMHATFAPMGREQEFLPRPPSARRTEGGTWEYDEALLAEWEVETQSLAAEHTEELAGIICEPVLQGVGGRFIYPPRVLQVLARNCV